MKRSFLVALVSALFCLFFIQMAGTLIQSIYVLDLMNTSLDMKVLGIFFFFTPLLLWPFRKSLPHRVLWAILGLLALARAITPSLSTSGRLMTSGVGVGLSLLLFPYMIALKRKDDPSERSSLAFPAGLALAVGLSVFLRTVNFSVDYSLTPAGAWVGWLLSVAFILALTQTEWPLPAASSSKVKGVTSSIIGIFMVLTLIYFIFSAPAVLARWTEGNYGLIVGLVSLLSLGTSYLIIKSPAFLQRVSQRWLFAGNVLFSLSLLLTILVQRVNFPATPQSSAVVVGAAQWYQQVPLYFMLLFFPVLFLDVMLFSRRLSENVPAPRAMIPGLLLGSLSLVVLVFIFIFTNVWGYIEPVSTPFRNQFWLPFFLICAPLCWLSLRKPGSEKGLERIAEKPFHPDWTLAGFALVFVLTLVFGFLGQPGQAGDPLKTSLTVMTFNIQAGNDGQAERSFERQLALIRQVSPDILAMQETDTARISMNNDDYVRYFAARLGYYSYYGPRTTAGTFGTAILSRYPLENPHSIFTYSDTDEIGTAVAQIVVGGKRFSIYDVHPDGSATAKMAFARELVSRSAGDAYVIALGDYNLRESNEAYQVVAARYTDAWKSLNPAEIGAGKGWIDHIFLSRNIRAKDPTYILPPESASDHPAHWTQIFWEP